MSETKDETPAESVPTVSPEQDFATTVHADLQSFLDNISPEQMTTLLNLAKEWPNLVANLASPLLAVPAPATPVIPTFGSGDTVTPSPVDATNNSQLLLSACCSMFQCNEQLLAEFGGRMNVMFFVV